MVGFFMAGAGKCPNQIQRDAQTCLHGLKIVFYFQCLIEEDEQTKTA